MNKDNNKEKITLSDIRGIEKLPDGNYLISLSASFSESPEFEDMDRKEIADILMQSGISKDEFCYDIVPYMSASEGEKLFDGILNNTTGSIYEYGMRSRPFSVGTYPQNDNYIGVLDGKDVSGTKYYNILQYSSPLSKEEISRFELSDFDFLSKGGETWTQVLKTIDYLIKRDLEDKFLTDSFYKQVGMSEDDFFSLLSRNGYSDPMDLYDELEKSKNSHIDKKNTTPSESDLLRDSAIRERMKDALEGIMLSPSAKDIRNYLKANTEHPRSMHPINPGVLYALALSADPNSIFTAYSREYLTKDDIKDYENFIKKQYAVTIIPKPNDNDTRTNNGDLCLFRAINAIKEHLSDKYVSTEIPNIKTSCSDNIENCVAQMLMEYPFDKEHKLFEQKDRVLASKALDVGYNYAKAVGDKSLSEFIFTLRNNKETINRDDMRRVATHIRDLPILRDDQVKNSFASHIVSNGYLATEGNPIAVKIAKEITLHMYPDYSVWATNSKGNLSSMPSSLIFPFMEEIKKREPDFFTPLEDTISILSTKPAGTHFTSERYREHDECSLDENRIIRDELYVNVGSKGTVTPNKWNETDYMLVNASKNENGSYYYMNGSNLNDIQEKIIKSVLAPTKWDIPENMSFLQGDIEKARENLGIINKKESKTQSKLDKMATDFKKKKLDKKKVVKPNIGG